MRPRIKARRRPVKNRGISINDELIAPEARLRLAQRIAVVRPQGAKPGAAPGIAKHVSASHGIRRLPGGGLEVGRSRKPVRRQTVAPSRGPSIAPATQPGIGRQLSRRVAAGEIDQEQAERTSRERALLKEEFGDDWRQDVYGQDLQNLRVGLAGAQKGNARWVAAQKAAKAARREALKKAREGRDGGLSSASAV